MSTNWKKLGCTKPTPSVCGDVRAQLATSVAHIAAHGSVTSRHAWASELQEPRMCIWIYVRAYSSCCNIHRWHMCATRQPRAVARAGAHVRANARLFPLMLWFALRPPVTMQVLHKLLSSRSTFRNLQRCQICAALLPQAIARVVARFVR